MWSDARAVAGARPPQVVDQLIGGAKLARVQEQGQDERPKQLASERAHTISLDYLERAEDAELERDRARPAPATRWMRSRFDMVYLLSLLGYLPGLDECGRVESNHHSTRRQGYSLLSSPMLSVRVEEGGRPGSNRRRGAHNPGCFRLHHGHHEAGTTGLEPAASRLTSERSARLSYAPEEVARVGFEPTVSSS